MLYDKFFQTAFRAGNLIRRHCSNSKVFTTSPSGFLNILLPFRTVIKPLDVHRYPDCDKVIIVCDEQIECSQIKDSINVTSPTRKAENGKTVCEIQAPIKTNINVNCASDITIGDFHGDNVRLFSEDGNIVIGNSKNEYICARANGGNITTEGSIDAAKVQLKTLKGNITAKKIKCLGLNIESDDGNVTTEASYCDESYFIIKNGYLNLKNVHKHCKVVIEDNGKLEMVGFNGLLQLVMNKGKADVQISELNDRSTIQMRDRAELVLRLSEEVLNSTSVELVSECCSVDDNIPHVENEEKNLVQIQAKDGGGTVRKVFKINGPKALVTVKKSSWSEMIEKSIKGTAVGQ